MATRGPARRPGFSLIELVIVVLIMATVTAIAIPRMSRGADNSDITALKANYSLLNRALGLYAAEHRGAFPGLGNITKALTMYSNESGTEFEPNPDPANGINYGPYLAKIPVVTYGPHTGDWKIAGVNGVGVGWIYRPSKKHILPNLRDVDGNLPDGVVEALGWKRQDWSDGGTTDTGATETPTGP